MRAALVVAVGLLPAAILGACWQTPAAAPTPVGSAARAPLPPWRIPVRQHREPPPSRSDLVPAEGNRCPERIRTRAFAFEGNRLVRDVSVDALLAEGDVRSVNGRRRRVVPLEAVYDSPGPVEVWPCRGQPLRFEAHEVAAWMLVETGKGTLKLATQDGQRTGIKNIAAWTR